MNTTKVKVKIYEPEYELDSEVLVKNVAYINTDYAIWFDEKIPVIQCNINTMINIRKYGTNPKAREWVLTIHKTS